MVAQSITQKQKDILLYLYQFRFLNSRQIQKLFEHKTPHRINAWLKDLYDHGYIGRIYEREKRSENIKPAIYHLSTKSIHVLKNEEGCDSKFLEKIYKEKGRKDSFIEHCLFIADIYLFIVSQKRKNEVLNFFTKSTLQGLDYLPKNLPDAYLSLMYRDQTTRYFLDLFNPNTPTKVLRNRIKEYLKYSRDYEWEASTDSPLPTILLVFSDEIMKNHALYYTRAKLNKEFDDKTKFFLTTKNKFQKPIDTINLWEEVI